jgi:hypothetical protein
MLTMTEELYGTKTNKCSHKYKILECLEDEEAAVAKNVVRQQEYHEKSKEKK